MLQVNYIYIYFQKYADMSIVDMNKFKIDYAAYLNGLTAEDKAQLKNDRAVKRKKLSSYRLKRVRITKKCFNDIFYQEKKALMNNVSIFSVQFLQTLKSLEKPKRKQPSFTFYVQDQMVNRGNTPVPVRRQLSIIKQ